MRLLFANSVRPFCVLAVNRVVNSDLLGWELNHLDDQHDLLRLKWFSLAGTHSLRTFNRPFICVPHGCVYVAGRIKADEAITMGED